MDNFTVVSFLHILFRILLVGGLVTFALALGEKVLGFSIRGAIDDIEKESAKGNVWPVAALLIASIFSLAYILG